MASQHRDGPSLLLVAALIVQMTSNNALVPDPDKEDIIASSPVDWPFLHLGMRMNGWGDTNPKYCACACSRAR